MTEPTEAVSDPQKPARLTSLDAFRGLTIAGMILVNNQGARGETYPPLGHAKWEGWTPTDLVFPFFLLIVGVAIPFSFGRRREGGSGWFGLLFKVVRRSLVIFAIGIALNGFPNYEWATIRIPGVLQRIALCYLLASLVELVAGVRLKVGLIAGLLLGYWAGNDADPGPRELRPGRPRAARGNLAAWVDRDGPPGAHHLQERHLRPGGDSSAPCPALATTLIGVLAGHLAPLGPIPLMRSGRGPIRGRRGSA